LPRFVSLFEKYADQYGLKAIMLASFAMQESSCNPATVGGAGEQGLMQLTVDKCGGAPGGNCKDPVSRPSLSKPYALLIFSL
jgi:membrane-bound lytic murein transglycosylase MltF